MPRRTKEDVAYCAKNYTLSGSPIYHIFILLMIICTLQQHSKHAAEQLMIRIIARRETDDKNLRDLFFKLREAVYNDTNSSESDFYKETEGEDILIALSNNEVVGFISVWVADNFVHHLYVKESYQNRNIGTLLLQSVIEKIGVPIRLKCVESNSKAIQFYRRKGFVEKERGQSESGAYILLELRNKLLVSSNIQ